MARKKLTEVCDIQYGYPFDASRFSSSPEDGMPLIRIRDVKDGHTETYFKGNYPKEYTIHRGDYLVGMDGEFNIAAWHSEDALLNQRVCKIESKSPSVSTSYLYRFLRKELKKIEDETPFVTVKHLSAKRLNQVEIDVPSLEEQERIVAELDLLTGIIDKQKAQLKELDTLAQSIFYDMFGDPVENEKGWNKKKIGIVCVSKKQIQRAAKRFKDTDTIQYIDISSIDNINNVLTSTTPYVFGEAPSRAQQVLEIGDILISLVRPNLNNVAMVSEIGSNLVASSGFCVLRASREIVKEFLFYSVKMDCFTDYLMQRVSGANYPAVREDDITGYSIITPPSSLQESFAKKIQAIETQKESINCSISETQKLFDYTMDKYFG